MAYCTTAELKRYLNITGTSDDTLLGELIDAATAMIDTATGTTFAVNSDSTRYLDAIGNVDGAYLLFDQWCASITSITNGDGVVVAATDYVTEPRSDAPYYGVKLKSSKDVTWDYDEDEENAIAVVGKWAYMTTPDAEVSQATKELAAWLYRRRENANDIDRAVVVGNATVLPTDYPPTVKRLITKYRPISGWK
ncbi:MAG: head-tail connector protein [Pontimonas sp.]